MLDHLFAECWTVCTLLDVTMPFQRHRPFCIQDSPLLHIPSNIATDMTGRPKSDVTRRYIGGASILGARLQLETGSGYRHLRHHLEKSPEWISFILSRWPTNNS
ncbi:hypothetical protein ATANTOWER_029640 [Ataeniobius toweri]|uniref:Uncharacterized protein n=1 Tax=Ataeniobius toweri TaxID=208326 RepID=A0ABU7BI39_9TELE|nr:hypothetical protein [Ataeniobius toweri]